MVSLFTKILYLGMVFEIVIVSLGNVCLYIAYILRPSLEVIQLTYWYFELT